MSARPAEKVVSETTYNVFSEKNWHWYMIVGRHLQAQVGCELLNVLTGPSATRMWVLVKSREEHSELQFKGHRYNHKQQCYVSLFSSQWGPGIRWLKDQQNRGGGTELPQLSVNSQATDLNHDMQTVDRLWWLYPYNAQWHT